MRIKVLPEPVIDSLRNRPALYRLARQTRFALGRVLRPFSVEGIPGRIHPNDFMLDATTPEGIAGYRDGAASVLGVLERSLAAADRPWDSVDRWLDFGSGYGRVTRYLAQRVGADKVWVTDLLPGAVQFCAKELGVHPVPNLANDPSLAGSFDVLYAVSVFTHISAEDADGLTALLTRALAPGGLLIFTTHGQASLDMLDTYGPYFSTRRAEIVDGIATSGYDYIPYAHSKDGSYGMAWSDTPSVERRVQQHAAWPVELVSHDPAGLDAHQDVFVYRRTS